MWKKYRNKKYIKTGKAGADPDQQRHGGGGGPGEVSGITPYFSLQFCDCGGVSLGRWCPHAREGAAEDFLIQLLFFDDFPELG